METSSLNSPDPDGQQCLGQRVSGTNSNPNSSGLLVDEVMMQHYFWRLNGDRGACLQGRRWCAVLNSCTVSKKLQLSIQLNSINLIRKNIYLEKNMQFSYFLAATAAFSPTSSIKLRNLVEVAAVVWASVSLTFISCLFPDISVQPRHLLSWLNGANPTL